MSLRANAWSCWVEQNVMGEGERMLTVSEALFGVLAQSGETVTRGKNLLEHVADGGWIGAVIIVLSLVGVVLAVLQLVQLRQSRLAPPEQVQHPDEMLRTGKLKQAAGYCEQAEDSTFLTRVVGTALVRCSRSPFGVLELKTTLEEAGQEETARLHRSVEGIGLIAAVTPMLGLLGTVVGMVGAFDTISLTEGFAKPSQLAGNISTALITTVLGLIVAIPATAAYAFFRNRIDTLAQQVAKQVEELASHVEAGAGRGGGSGGASASAPAGGAARTGRAPASSAAQGGA